MRGRYQDEARRPDRGPDEADDSVLGVLIERLATIERAITDRLTTIEQVMGRLLQDKGVDKEWYSTSELAEVMKVSIYTVTERWCHQGRVVCEKDPHSGRWLIPGAEYRRLVKGGALRPKSK
jgi:hypothetical protein